MTNPLRWDRFAFAQAHAHLNMSKDPSTHCGAVIVGPDRETLCGGFNGFPRGINDSEERLTNRELKHKLVVHAEANSLLVAAKRGIKIQSCHLYLIVQSTDGMYWGGPPCSRCIVEIIQVGLASVTVLAPPSPKAVTAWMLARGYTSSWLQDYELSRELMSEAGIFYREIDGKELGYA